MYDGFICPVTTPNLTGPDPRSPGTHIVGSWVIDSTSFYRDPRTGTQYIGNWTSRVIQCPPALTTATYRATVFDAM